MAALLIRPRLQAAARRPGCPAWLTGKHYSCTQLHQPLRLCHVRANKASPQLRYLIHLCQLCIHANPFLHSDECFCMFSPVSVHEESHSVHTAWTESMHLVSVLHGLQLQSLLAEQRRSGLTRGVAVFLKSSRPRTSKPDLDQDWTPNPPTEADTLHVTIHARHKPSVSAAGAMQATGHKPHSSGDQLRPSGLAVDACRSVTSVGLAVDACRSVTSVGLAVDACSSVTSVGLAVDTCSSVTSVGLAAFLQLHVLGSCRHQCILTCIALGIVDIMTAQKEE